MSEIQRYEIRDYDPGVKAVTRPPREMDLVEYSDHLRAVTLAKIEVLEEMLQQVSVLSDFKSMHVTEWLDIKIAALRKELER